MTDFESKLKTDLLLNIVELSSKINPLLNTIYKEEYYAKLKENNKKMILLRCKNKNCYQLFMDSSDYEIINTKKENKRKKLDNKFNMNIRCNKCNFVSSFNLSK